MQLCIIRLTSHGLYIMHRDDHKQAVDHVSTAYMHIECSQNMNSISIYHMTKSVRHLAEGQILKY